jgi:hypothetical protein
MDSFHAPNGANHFPLDPSNDNLYTAVTDTSFLGIGQCHVDITRMTGDQYSATYYGPSNDEIGRGSSPLNNDGDRLILSPDQSQQVQYTSLVIIRTGEMGHHDTRGSRINFESVADGNVRYSNPLTDIRFSTESTGFDKRYSDANDEGGYCHVPNIEDTESYSIQKITCYYPCMFSSG